jgi:hypothetical protein
VGKPALPGVPLALWFTSATRAWLTGCITHHCCCCDAQAAAATRTRRGRFRPARMSQRWHQRMMISAHESCEGPHLVRRGFRPGGRALQHI